MAVCLWVTSMSMQAASAISTLAESLSPHAHERSPMDLALSEEQKMIVEMVRQFVREEIVPLEEHLDPDADELPPEDYDRLVAQTKAMGLYGLDTPPEFGGPDIDLVTRCLIAIECSQHRAGLYAPCYNVFGGARRRSSSRPRSPKSQVSLSHAAGRKESLFGLSEPSGGSDPARAIQTRAVRDGDEWVLNGTKLWISGADRADYGLIFARTGPDKGRAGVTCFIVETAWPGFQVRRIVHTLRSAKYATEIHLEDLRVPHENILGTSGVALPSPTLGWRASASPMLRNVSGSPSRRTRWRWRMPKSARPSARRWRHARAFSGCSSTTRSIFAPPACSSWMRRPRPSAANRSAPNRPWRNWSAEASGRVVDRSMQIHGGLGVAKDLPLERWYREIRIRRIGEGPSEVQAHYCPRHPRRWPALSARV